MDKKTLERQVADAAAEMRGLLDTAEKENRDLSDEEKTQFDDAEKRAGAAKDNLRRLGAVGELDKFVEGRRYSRPSEDVDDPNIGLSDGEKRDYRLLRAIRAAATNDWRHASLEQAASRAVAEKVGRDPQGFFIPHDVLAHGERRTDSDYLSVGLTGHTADKLVATDLLVGSFIDMLRNRMVVNQAGATVLAGLVGDIAIPRQTGGATAYWLSEDADTTISKQTFDQVTLTPRTVAAHSQMTRKLLQQSSIDVEAMIRRDLSTALALAIDRAAFHGRGPTTYNEPTGIAATSGIGSVEGGTNGAAPDWADIVNLETEVAQDNADMGRMAYITNTKVRGKLKQTSRVSGQNGFIWADDGSLNGYRALVTNQVSSTLTKGSSSGICSAIFFGNWADLLIGMWGSLDVLVNPFKNDVSGRVAVTMFQDMDLAVRHAQSFSAMLDALTT